jgi:hypothetical protein
MIHIIIKTNSYKVLMNQSDKQSKTIRKNPKKESTHSELTQTKTSEAILPAEL